MHLAALATAAAAYRRLASGAVLSGNLSSVPRRPASAATIFIMPATLTAPRDKWQPDVIAAIPGTAYLIVERPERERRQYS